MDASTFRQKERDAMRMEIRDAAGEVVAYLNVDCPKALEFIDRRLYGRWMMRPLLVVPPGGRLEIGAAE